MAYGLIRNIGCVVQEERLILHKRSHCWQWTLPEFLTKTPFLKRVLTGWPSRSWLSRRKWTSCHYRHQPRHHQVSVCICICIAIITNCWWPTVLEQERMEIKILSHWILISYSKEREPLWNRVVTTGRIKSLHTPREDYAELIIKLSLFLAIILCKSIKKLSQNTLHLCSPTFPNLRS